MKRPPSFPFSGRRTIPQVARLIGLKPSEVAELVHHGPLVARQYGRELLVHHEDLERFVRGEW